MGIKYKLSLVTCIIFILIVSMPLVVSAADTDPIIFGITNSLGKMEGKESLNAVNLAVEQINAKGGITVGGVKRKIKVEAMDTRSANAGVPISEALLGIEKMILEKKAHALVMGPWRSEAVLASMDLIAKYKIPMMLNIAQSPKIEARIKKEPVKYRHTFRTGLSANQFVGYMMGAMNFMKKEFGFTRVFIMAQDVLWAQGVAKISNKLLTKSGWTVVGTEAFPVGASDYSTAMLKVGASGAQVIFSAFDMHECGVMVKQWKAMKVPAVMAGALTPVYGSEAWKSYKEKIEGLINVFMESGDLAIPQIPKSVAFFNAYKQRYGKEIQSCHGPAPAYDNVYILADAIERANSLDGDAIAAALAKTDYSGAMGRVKFNEGHQVIFGNDPSKTAVGGVFQWREGGKRVVVYPKSVASGDIVLPKGLKAAK